MDDGAEGLGDIIPEITEYIRLIAMTREEFNAEIDRMLAVQRELQDSQLRHEAEMSDLREQSASLLRMVETQYRTSVNLLDAVNQQGQHITQQGQQIAQLKQAVDYLLSHDGEQP